MLLTSALLVPHADAAYILAVGDDVTLPVGGNFARVVVDDTGAYTLFWAAGGDYNRVPLGQDFTLNDQERVLMTGHTDLIDHAIRRCPDGTWLHAASLNVTDMNDTARVFRYDAALNLTNEVLLDDQNPDIRHNDMALLCSDHVMVGFASSEGGYQWLFELDDDGTELQRTEVDAPTQLMGGGLWEDRAGNVNLVGRPSGFDMQMTELDAELAIVESVSVPEMSPGGGTAYWPQGVIRVGDYVLVAHMGRESDSGWSQDTGNVYLSVVSIADKQLVEQVAITAYEPGDGAMRPWAARDGDDIVLTWDKQLAPHVTRVTIDPAALGETAGDTGGGDDTADSGAGATGDRLAYDGGGCGCATGGGDRGFTALVLVGFMAFCRRSTKLLAPKARWR